MVNIIKKAIKGVCNLRKDLCEKIANVKKGYRDL